MSVRMPPETNSEVKQFFHYVYLEKDEFSYKYLWNCPNNIVEGEMVLETG